MARRSAPSVLTALNASLKASAPADADAATVALAKRYAVELDDSAVVGKAVHKALEKLRKLDDVPEDLYFELTTLAVRIEEAHVAALIGPKLLAALTELQLTPKARNAVVQGGGVGNAGPTQLDKLRAARDGRTPAVDPTA